MSKFSTCCTARVRCHPDDPPKLLAPFDPIQHKPQGVVDLRVNFRVEEFGFPVGVGKKTRRFGVSFRVLRDSGSRVGPSATTEPTKNVTLQPGGMGLGFRV